ncbi:MAG: B12-binding domain-containing radical SAM protein, partial [Thermodesulfobacteriota bacterium]
MQILLIEFNPFQPEHTPISLGYLSAYAKASGFPTDLLNVGSNTRMSIAAFSQLLEDSRPRLIGFSAYQRNIFLVDGWAQACKRLLPETRVLIGGPQATFMPTHALRGLPSIDLICRAEGEVALLELAGRMKEGQPLIDVPGWSGRGPDDTLWDGPTLGPCQDLDAYPSPYLDGTLDPAKMGEAILLASRGCPYKCAFCYTPKAFGKRIRYHSLERVI